MHVVSRISLTTLLITSLLYILVMFPIGVPIAKGSPQLGEVSVNVGDWAKYGNVTIRWNSNDSNAEPGPHLILANQTVWFKHAILEVQSTMITFRNETYLKNGEMETNDVWVDIYEGYGKGALMFISADLKKGDLIYSGSLPPLFINETLSRTYLGVVRTVNHLDLTFNDSQMNPPQFIQISFDYYWDKETGILTERKASYYNKTGEYLTSWSRSDIILDTNLWILDTEPPKANAGNDKTASPGETVNFDASGSTDNVDIVSYRWNFGDGTTLTQEDPFATHLYTEPGDYTVTLTVKDAAGMTSTDQIKVIVKADSNAISPLWVLAVTAIILFGVFIFYQKMKSSSKARKRRTRRHDK